MLPVPQQEHLHVVLPLDEDLPPLLEVVPLRHHLPRPLVDLHAAVHAAAVHSARDVDGVAPDVVVELGGADHAARDVAVVEADAENEVELYQRLVEILNRVLEAVGELHEL